MMSHREAGFSVMERYHLPRKVTPLATNYKQPAGYIRQKNAL